MSGRIKLLRDGVPISDRDHPKLGYEYDKPGRFDKRCGTHALEEYQLPNSECPAKFVCGTEDSTGDLMKHIAPCYDAMNCAMFQAMTTKASSGSEVALFIHHMIPHHAVSQFLVGGWVPRIPRADTHHLCVTLPFAFHGSLPPRRTR